MQDKEKLGAFLVERGVIFVEVKEEGAALHAAWEAWRKERGLKEAPFTSYLGCIPQKRTIVGRPNTPWPHILHEAGHLLAQAIPLSPKSEEIAWFGWEWAVVQHLDLCVREFLHDNKAYIINWDGPYAWREEVGDLKEEEAPLFFQERILEAQGLGVVDVNGVPLAHPNNLLQ